ncbi:10554_t:CDS:2 [Funneliformis geosporum]|uniref:10554_t:CDS:1 n=1 Tax=Funneliformis geosporum TaxID=1117311 RepID=A0A9W4WQ52_9GLOM|nr:10554_t:CDS:2 [Funneliformis geosporum]
MKTNILIYSKIVNPSVCKILKAILGTNYDIIQIDSNDLLMNSWFEITSCLIFLSSNKLNINQQLFIQKEFNNNILFEKKFEDYLKSGGNYLDPIVEIPLKLNRESLLNHLPFVQNQIEIPCDNSIGYFDSLGDNVTSIATYNNSSTIIQYDIGNGKVILCGLDPFFNIVKLEQKHLIRSLFSTFGLNLSQNNESTPSQLSFTLHLTSIRPALTNLWLNNINSLTDSNNIIKASNDSFRIIVNSHDSDLSQDANKDDNMDIPKSIIVYRDQPPPLSTTPFFNFKDFFDHLSKERNIESGGGNKMEFGSTVLYGEVVSSTQTLLDKNFKFTQNLPTGFVCTATQQNQGRGRGKNSWISPLGCLQFSVVLRHPSNIASVVFIQYLLSLAVVEAIRTKKGYEDLPLRLKWPNDIYTENFKIGGVIINSHFVQDEFLLIAGCGVNLSNSAPTTSVNRIISLYNHDNKSQLKEFSQEQLLASILVKFESFYKEFCSHKNGFEPFLDIYYKRWLHKDQIVTLEAFNNRRARIIGITTDYGFLKARFISEDDDNLEEIILQPDGNSFDMMKGMISRKS